MESPNRATQPTLLGIDWGTSNRRAWWLSDGADVLAEHHDDQGLLAAQGRFPQALNALLKAGPPLADGGTILMAGMVGAASGWQEAPYMDAALPLAQLAEHLQAVAAAGPRCFIVPGVCFSAPDGTVDVMRGEETQLLGALALGKLADERAATRKGQVGSGDRSQRIRTYNFAQGRVSDHRINLTLHKLDAVLEGDLDELIEALITDHQASLLADANLGA